jgi:zinc protease
MIERIVSPAGIEAWLVEDYAVPVVAIDAAFKGGAAHDPAGKAGATQLMSSLLDEGAGDLDDQAYQLQLEEHALELSFSATRDQINASLRMLAGKRAEGARLMALALQAPRFDTDAVERVRESYLAALRREANDPGSMASRALFKALFPGHPYAESPRGTIETMGSLDRTDAQERFRALIARDALRVSIVGAISKDEATSLLDTIFAPLPAKATLVDLPRVQPAAIGQRKLIDLDVPQSVVQVATPGLLRDDPDFMAAIVVNHILGGGAFSSRLYQEVREKRGLAYSVSTQLLPLAHSALVVGGVATRNDRAAESVRLIEAEFRRMAADGPTEDELSSAKKYLTGSYALRFDTSGKIANQLTQIQVEGFGTDYVDRRNGLVEAVTMEDARRAARRMFGDGQALVVAVGRPEGLGEDVAAAA